MTRMFALAFGLAVLCVSVLSPQARADDKNDCQAMRGKGSMAACNRMIASGRLRGHALAVAYHRRAAIWRAIEKNNDKAIADDDEAIRLDPKYAAAISSRSLSLWQKGDFDRALTDANAAIALDPMDPKSHNRRGLAQQGRPCWRD
jgi:tetratricopeptide (TPR) repeat protein